MEDEKDAFYVVRKGDIIGIYRSFSDCQAQAGFSPLDPSISVYKGYGLSKETESYLLSRGLQQAGFSISACDLQDGLFGRLSICPFQDVGEPSCSTLNPSRKNVKLENYVEAQASVGPASVAIPAPNGRIQKQVDTGLNVFQASHQQNSCELKNNIRPVNLVPAESISFSPKLQKKISDLRNYQELVPSTSKSCTIEFDGASKGNPGQAGAGAVMRAVDGGNEVWLLREGVGVASNNVAEYRAVILGLRTALQKGFKHVKVRGDSLLVCNQIQGIWKCKHENMAKLCKDALLLKKQFMSFTIEHVPREFNSAADAQANRAINLRDGQVEIEMKSRA